MFSYHIFLKDNWYCYNKFEAGSVYNTTFMQSSVFIKNMTHIVTENKSITVLLPIWKGSSHCSLDLGFRWIVSPALLSVRFPAITAILTTTMASVTILLSLLSRFLRDANSHWVLLLIRLGLNISTPMMGFITILSTLFIAEYLSHYSPLNGGITFRYSMLMAACGVLVFLLGAMLEVFMVLVPDFRPSLNLVRRNWLSAVYDMTWNYKLSLQYKRS